VLTKEFFALRFLMNKDAPKVFRSQEKMCIPFVAKPDTWNPANLFL